MINLEQACTFFTVTMAHCALLLWIATDFGQTPPQIVPPAIHGVLVAAAAAPGQPLPTTAPTPPRPAPSPPKPARPKPTPPKPAPPKPETLPQAMPPSERAITLPESEPEIAAPAPAAEESGAEPGPAPPSSQLAPSLPGPASHSGSPGVAGESGPVTLPRVDARHLNNPAPAYPPASRRLREEGTVLLDVHILPDGSVREVRLRASSGFARLDQAALNAVRHWRYVPAQRGDKPIAYWYSQPVVFSLTMS